MQAMTNLIERLQSGSEPDRELDCEVAEACGFRRAVTLGPNYLISNPAQRPGVCWECPKYTHPIKGPGECLALVKKVMRGHCIYMSTHWWIVEGKQSGPGALISKKNDGSMDFLDATPGRHKTDLTRAILMALLTAREERRNEQNTRNRKTQGT